MLIYVNKKRYFDYTIITYHDIIKAILIIDYNLFHYEYFTIYFLIHDQQQFNLNLKEVVH